MLIAITAAYLPVHVAAGLTRRGLALGVAARRRAAPAVVYGVVLAGLLLVERAVFDALGWQWRIARRRSSPDGAGTASAASSATALMFIVAYVSGLLVGDRLPARRRLVGRPSPCRSPPARSCSSSALFAQDAGPFSTVRVVRRRPAAARRRSVVAVLIAAVMAFAFDRLTRGASVPARTS